VFCAALVAFYHRIPVGHVEAGLRTGNLFAPWPEEANRVLASRLAALHFAPTDTARQCLLREGIPPRQIFVTGNTVIDALQLAVRKVEETHPDVPGLPPGLLDGGKEQVVLITGHRRENFGEGFESICYAIRELADSFPQVHFVYPVHLNPNVREPVLRILGSAGSARCHSGGSSQRSKPTRRAGGRCDGNIHLLDPPYLSYGLMKRAKLILTDSGGTAGEAPDLGNRSGDAQNDRAAEAVAAGTCGWLAASRRKIVETSALLTNQMVFDQPGARRWLLADHCAFANTWPQARQICRAKQDITADLCWTLSTGAGFLWFETYG
jgi:UDP-N-acetylglucosamine 2-epimerase (non-hydrolysing)